uniref:Ig-like domain-containing protein n=1 Tax=Cyprinus carpio TaxID=7962 RepID=A0A8C1UT81_CYPCA
WGVNYSPLYICALKGSTVTLSCSLTYTGYYKLTTAFWTKTAITDGEPTNICSDPQYRGRVQCVTEYKDIYRLFLGNVTEADKHIYYCRFRDAQNKGRTVIPGARLDVTDVVLSDLQVETQQSVKERDSVTLTCKSSCSLPQQTTFIWFRNTQRLTRGIITENQLQLQSVSRQDSGNYQLTQTLLQKSSVPPKSILVSISPSGEIVEGDSVTLICSSDSNPPALNFSWFKEGNSAVGSGQSFIISSFNSSHSGRYYCEAQNKHGSQRSASVSVSVKGILYKQTLFEFHLSEDVIYTASLMLTGDLDLSSVQVMFQLPLRLISPIYTFMGLFYCLDINGFQLKVFSFIPILIVNITQTAFTLHSHMGTTYTCNSQRPFSSRFVLGMSTINR